MRATVGRKAVKLEIDEPGEYQMEISAGKGVRVFQIIVDKNGDVGLFV